MLFDERVHVDCVLHVLDVKKINLPSSLVVAVVWERPVRPLPERCWAGQNSSCVVCLSGRSIANLSLGESTALIIVHIVSQLREFV